jgi:ABC-2 type transport system ATP-binding protein
MIDVHAVTKQFGNRTVVDGISFQAAAGEIFGLIGPNGAGKTTTIRMIMNILAPDSGSILIGGSPLKEQDKERIGYLPEERGLYPKVTVEDMLLYLATLKGRSPADIRPRIHTLLEQFDLYDWRDKKIEELSKGMSQKVQFIGSIIHDPEIVIFDEPFSGLDPVSADMLLEMILEMGSRKKTILFSTHLMEHAEKICNRIFLINHGKEVVSGRTESIKEQFGKRTVIVEYDGDGEFMRDLSFVENITRYPRWIEVELTEGTPPDELLREIAGTVSVKRYELTTPSLHSIFIRLVGSKEQPEPGEANA